MDDSRYASGEIDEQQAPKCADRRSSRMNGESRGRSSRMLRVSSTQNLMGREPSDRHRDVSSSERKSSSKEKVTDRDEIAESRSQRVSLSATSYHGGSRSGPHGANSGRVRRGAGPVRHKSSDNPESMGVGSSTSSTSSSSSSRRGDELGATTLHGTSVSRIRSQRGVLQRQQSRRGSSSISKGDRRPAMKRAMSTENVKRPEEYGPRGSSVASASMYGGSEVRRGRRRPKVEDEEPLVVEVEEAESEEVEEDSDDDSEEDDSFAAEDDDEPKHESPVRVMSNQRKEQTHRDLLVLVRDQKTVLPSDFNDKDNRRLLHFLIFQHKLGVDLAELHANVTHDISLHGAEAMRYPVLPLYVEPA